MPSLMDLAVTLGVEAVSPLVAKYCTAHNLDISKADAHSVGPGGLSAAFEALAHLQGAYSLPHVLAGV